MLEIRKINKTFNAGTVNAKHALKDLSLTLNDGDFVTVIGGNGAGKSTMLNAIAGVWPIDEGSILIDGVDGTKLIEIEKPAMEIDGGYEGKTKISLIEAKNYLPKDFIIRQLYFPYRHWIERVRKPIVPIFFAYDNGIYTFFVYEFTNKDKYKVYDSSIISKRLIAIDSNYELINFKEEDPKTYNKTYRKFYF